MKRTIHLIFLLTAITIGCNQQPKEETPEQRKEKLQLEISQMEDQLTKAMKVGLDKSLAEQLVTFYKDFADANTKDSIAPEYLFKAAEVSIGLKKYDDAVTFFKRIYNHYPAFNKRVESLYLVGFVYDEHLNQLGKAKEVYEQLVKQHPNHPFAEDARASIQTLGLSDEELIKKFEELNAKQQP